MNDEISFSSLKELYNRVLPALYSKSKELRNLGFNYISEKDIWNYLVENKWSNRVNLELHELISDIIHADNYVLKDYVMGKLNKLKEKEEISDINKNI